MNNKARKDHCLMPNFTADRQQIRVGFPNMTCVKNFQVCPTMPFTSYSVLAKVTTQVFKLFTLHVWLIFSSTCRKQSSSLHWKTGLWTARKSGALWWDKLVPREETPCKAWDTKEGRSRGCPMYFVANFWQGHWVYGVLFWCQPLNHQDGIENNSCFGWFWGHYKGWTLFR